MKQYGIINAPLLGGEEVKNHIHIPGQGTITEEREERQKKFKGITSG